MKPGRMTIADIGGAEFEVVVTAEGACFHTQDTSPMFDLEAVRAITRHLVGRLLGEPLGHMLRELRRSVVALQIGIDTSEHVESNEYIARRLTNVTREIDRLGSALGVRTHSRYRPRRRAASSAVRKGE